MNNIVAQGSDAVQVCIINNNTLGLQKTCDVHLYYIIFYCLLGFVYMYITLKLSFRI